MFNKIALTAKRQPEALSEPSGGRRPQQVFKRQSSYAGAYCITSSDEVGASAKMDVLSYYKLQVH
ncbi:hypothetical protein AAHH84_00340 [Candidatus Hodgkinia cicadicola]